MLPAQLKTCNLDYLFELAKGDMTFVKEMVNVFLLENAGEVKVLEGRINEMDYVAIKQIAHKLRSSIPYVGLDRLIGEALLEIEEMAKDYVDMDMIREKFKLVDEVSQKAILELRELEL